MSSFTAVFEIIEDKNCPLYELHDVLQLTDKALAPPPSKPVCLILAREMTELLFALISQSGEESGNEKLFSCSGCSGLIKFKMQDSLAASNANAASLSAIMGVDKDVPTSLAEGLEKIALFQAVEKENLTKVLPCFSYKKFGPGAELFRKGDEGSYVSVILSGKVAVFDDNLTLAVLGKGDILGEMSQLTSQAVCATVKAVEKTEVLCISGDDLQKAMNNNPSLYMYFLRLLTDRLTLSNAARLQEVASAMSGSLEEMPQVELFQLLNMNAKTGVLTLDLPQGIANIAFREGEMIRASYAGKEKEEAVNSIVAEKNKGRFKFSAGLSAQDMQAEEMGDFMKLIMDALRKVDEESSTDEDG